MPEPMLVPGGVVIAAVVVSLLNLLATIGTHIRTIAAIRAGRKPKRGRT